MPAAIAVAINWIGASVFATSVIGTALLAVTAGMVSAVLFVGGLAYSSSKAKKAKQQAKDAYNAAQVDRLVNVASAIGPRELVLGKVRKGGTVIFKGSTGAYQKDFYMVIALAAHQVEAIDEVWLNDELMALDVDGDVANAPYAVSSTRTVSVGGSSTVLPANYVVGSVTASAYQWVTVGDNDRYQMAPISVTVVGLVATAAATGVITYQVSDTTSNVRITKYLGAPGQTADPELMAAFPGVWTATDTLDGIAYIVARLTYSETSFPNGLPNITATLRGAKLYDPRSGLTVYSDNPALMMRHVYSHAKFGKASVSAAEDARFVVAANACDASTTYTIAGVAQAAQALYTASLVLPFGAPPRDGLDDLAQAMGGSWAHMGGELFVKAGVYSAPVLTLTEADLAVVQRNGASESQQPISIAVHRERAQKYNTVKVKIWDQAQDYKQVSLSPLVGSALLARDGVELVQEVTYPAVGYAPQAQHIAGIMMRDARDPLAVELPVKLTMYRLEIFDTISVTLPRYGWSAKTFMVLGRAWNPDGTLQVSLKETTAAITQMDAGFLAQGFASNTNLPKPWEIQKVGTLSVSSGTNELMMQQDGTVVSRMRISWAQSTDISVTQEGQIEVQYRLATSSGAWTSLVVPGDETQVVAADVEDRAIYVIRARSKTKLALSDWNLQTTHQVIGKTEPPANVLDLSIAGLVLTWTAVTDIDLAGYVFRFHYGANFDWGTAAPLHTGLQLSSPFTLSTRPAGVVTIMCKAQDTTGNQSLASANIVTDLGDVPVANVVETFDFDPAYPGTITGGAVSGGNILANDTDSFYGTDSQSAYGEENAPAYDATSYDQVIYITPEVGVVSVLSGSLMTLDTSTEGTDLRIDYRLAAPGSAYGAENDSAYGLNDEPFYSAPGAWAPWPGQVMAEPEVYQWRITIGAGAVRGQINTFAVVIDAPDIVEYLQDVTIAAAGTAIPYTAAFTAIKTITATLQANASGAVTLETDKTTPLTPTVKAYNAAHTSVSGATADFILKGY